ncbi:MAG: tRNA (guanosine(37)-N1)-methyltransferase TrmD [Deltaproteobacteria bacterium]|nr:MAG: tRNA (guanosine(37)-N1)-methyltransferase TrmD [Deltaproteobacteria bacterium]
MKKVNHETSPESLQAPRAFRFDILTLFPHIFDSVFSDTILLRALEKELFSVHYHQIRDFTLPQDKHRKVDDVPYGGGAGMVMKPEPIVAAMEKALEDGAGKDLKKVRRIYLSPQGRPLQQKHLKAYLQYDQIILLCGRYEGVDERALELVIDEEVSIGDYVLTGGEFAAMVFMDAVVRLIPGVVGSEASLGDESFSQNLLEYPQYTRPPEFRDKKVPEILLSGDHKKIENWRRAQSLSRTTKKRPDLLK